MLSPYIRAVIRLYREIFVLVTALLLLTSRNNNILNIYLYSYIDVNYKHVFQYRYEISR